MPAHYKIKIIVDVYYVDSWDNETMYIKVDGATKVSQASGNAFNICGHPSIPEWVDRIRTHVIEMNHASSFFDISFSSSLDSHPGDESWGIRNF